MKFLINKKVGHKIVVLIIAFAQSLSAFSADETVVFSDDFSSDSLSNWTIEDSSLWSVENGVLRGEGDWATTTQEYFDDRFHVTFRIKLIGDDVHLNLRNGNSGRYFINFGTGGVSLSKQYWPDTFLNNLDEASGNYSSNTWYDIDIVHEAGELVMSVDGVEKIRYSDDDPLTSGNFGFEVFSGSPIEADDIKIYGEAAEESAPWITTGGPQGGLGYDIRIHPENSNLMYVTDANAGVFKSTNGGQNWLASNTGIDARTGSTGDLIPVFCLNIDPNNTNTLWAGTAGVRGIYRSTDGGSNWERKDTGIVESTGITFRGFAIEPGNSSVVYVAAEVSSSVWNGEGLNGREFDMTQGVVYKTINAGSSWSEVWRGDNLARYILIDPNDTDVVYVSTGIFDREAANSDPDTSSKTVPGGEGVLKSTDAGANWENINTDLDNLYVGSLAMHPQDSARLLAGVGNNQYFSQAGVYYSDDGGENWNRASGIFDIITSVEFSESDSNIAYAGSIDAIYRSENQGETWSQVGEDEWGPNGIRAGFPIDFQLDVNDADRLFVNNYGGGNFITVDGGETWSNASNGYTGAQVRDVIVDQENPGHIIAAARSGLFETPDGGSEWVGRNNDSMKVLELNAIAMSPDNNLDLVAGSNWNQKLSISDDGGVTWSAVGQSLSGNEAWRVITFANTSRVYAGSAGYVSAGSFTSSVAASGIQRSNNGGDSWSWVNSGSMSDAHVTSIAVAADDEDQVFAATTNQGILRSSNGGTSWQSLSGGLPDIAALAIAVAPNNSAIVYAGFEFGGLYKSSDGGDNWSTVASGLNPEGQITDIVFDPVNSETIYVGDKSSGVYRSLNGGSGWSLINTDLSNREINSLAISGDGLHLYAATEGGGVFRFDVNEAVPAVYDLPETETGSETEGGSASFSGGVLSIPVVAVGNTFYQVDLTLTDAATFEFQIGGLEELSNPSTSGMSTFSNNIVSIPEVIVGAVRYRVELDLTAADPITFKLAAAEEL